MQRHSAAIVIRGQRRSRCLQFAASSQKPHVGLERRSPLFLAVGESDRREAQQARRSHTSLGYCLKPRKAQEPFRITQHEPHADRKRQESSPPQLEQVCSRTTGAQDAPVLVSKDLRVMMHFATHTYASQQATESMVRTQSHGHFQEVLPSLCWSTFPACAIECRICENAPPRLGTCPLAPVGRPCPWRRRVSVSSQLLASPLSFAWPGSRSLCAS